MFSHLWFAACLLASYQVSGHETSSDPAARLLGLTNGDRIRQGLPLNAPQKRGTPRYHAHQARASESRTTQNTVIQATTGGMGRRAGETFIAFDDAANAFRLTSIVDEAATFVVPASNTGVTQVQFYTSDGLYYLGAAAGPATSTTSSSFLICGTKTSDLGAPGNYRTQTTIWSFAGIPGALTGTFSALDTSFSLYLSYDANNYIFASSTPAEASRRVSLSLVTIDSLNTVAKTVVAPAENSTLSSDPNVDPNLGVFDSALNTGAGGDEAALKLLMECLMGQESTECDALLASLNTPTP